MKYVKKLVALLTMVSVLAMGLTVFAAEPTGIGFEQVGLSCNMQIGVPAPCKNPTYEYEMFVYPFFTVLSDEIIVADGIQRQQKPGYEWRKVTVQFWSDDWNVYEYGIRTKECFEDYYDIVFHDQTAVYNEETDTVEYSVIKDGIVYSECERYIVYGEWIDEEVYDEYGGLEKIIKAQLREYYYCIPIGYDGTVLGFFNAAIEWGDGQYIYDIADADTIFYRLQ